MGVETISAHSTDGTFGHGIRITNNYVHDNITDGMELHSQYLTVAGNIIYDNITTAWASTHPDGIQLLAGTADGFTAVQHVKIYNNQIRNHTQNIFSEGTLAGASADTQDIQIFNNVVFNTMTTVNGVNMATLGGVNLMIKWSKDVYIVNNTLGDIGSSGNSIHVQDCFNGSVHIKNNNIINSVSYGVYVEDPSDISAGEFNYNSYYVTAADNIIWNTTFYATRAAFHTAVPTQETNGISGNPTVNAFPTPTLIAGSPAINAGVNLTSLAITELLTDAAGVSRPTPTGAWEIGAYEFVASATPVSRRR